MIVFVEAAGFSHVFWSSVFTHRRSRKELAILAVVRFRMLPAADVREEEVVVVPTAAEASRATNMASLDRNRCRGWARSMFGGSGVDWIGGRK